MYGEVSLEVADTITLELELEHMQSSVACSFQGDINSIGSALTHLAANLTTLDLSDNNIGGTLTAANSPFCQLSIGALEFLNLQINNITGELPSCLLQTGMQPLYRMNKELLMRWSSLGAHACKSCIL